MAIYVSWMEVGGVVGLPKTHLALPFLPGQFDDLYVKMRIYQPPLELYTNVNILQVGTSQTGAVYILEDWKYSKSCMGS